MTKPQTTPNICYLCENLHGTTFASPDGKWLIHVDYETSTEEKHSRDEFNSHCVDHYYRQIDKIKSVSMEAI